LTPHPPVLLPARQRALQEVLCRGQRRQGVGAEVDAGVGLRGLPAHRAQQLRSLQWYVLSVHSWLFYLHTISICYITVLIIRCLSHPDFKTEQADSLDCYPPLKRKYVRKAKANVLVVTYNRGEQRRSSTPAADPCSRPLQPTPADLAARRCQYCLAFPRL